MSILLIAPLLFFQQPGPGPFVFASPLAPFGSSWCWRDSTGLSVNGCISTNGTSLLFNGSAISGSLNGSGSALLNDVALIGNTGSSINTLIDSGFKGVSLQNGYGNVVSTVGSNQFISSGRTVNIVSATSYTLNDTSQTNTDCQGSVIFTSATAVTLTIPQAGFNSKFLSKCSINLITTGSGTITGTLGTGSIIGGNLAQTIIIPPNRQCELISDGTNWNVGACSAMSVSNETFRTVSGTTDTLTPTDCGNTVLYTGAANFTVTVPSLATMGSFCKFQLVNFSSGGGTGTLNFGTTSIFRLNSTGTTYSMLGEAVCDIKSNGTNYLTACHTTN